jgi:Domain of unknown function (DUF4279)
VDESSGDVGYGRWTEYDSYAYLVVCDGPNDNSDDIAPPAAPPPGDPKLYSLDPSEFTATAGVQPTRTARRGNRRHASGRHETRNLWGLRSALSNDAAPHEHVKNILAQLNVHWYRFLEVSRPYLVVMYVVSKGTNPGLALDRPEVEMLAQIRASIDVDMYPDGGEEAEDA